MFMPAICVNVATLFVLVFLNNLLGTDACIKGAER